MNKFELLKTIVNSQQMIYSLHKDIPQNELKQLLELETENFLYRINKSLRPTEKGLKAVNFNSFEEFESN